MNSGKEPAMKRRCLLVLFGSLLAVNCGFSGAPALAATPFTITAANVTMPTTGVGFSQFTVTSIPMAGTLVLSCQYSGPATQARLPLCPMTPPAAYQVTAGQTLTGSIAFYPYGSPVPAGLPRTPHRSGHLPAAGLVLAGALMLGLGLRRRKWRWLALAIFAAGTLAVLAAISACGGHSNGMTPGTYRYTVTAVNDPDPAVPPAQVVSTAIEVTVP
jgi:hypothetical protein